MLVAFDATPLEVSCRTGVSQYVAHLLDALAAREDGYRYALIASRRLRGPLPRGTLGQVGARFPNRWLWMQAVVPLLVARLSPQLCHFTNAMAPLALGRPFVLTIYDMSLFLHARTQPRRSLLLVRSVLPLVARRATMVVAISESARADILRVLGLSAERVRVVSPAPGPRFRPVTDPETLARVVSRYRLDAPFVLAVATIEPRKNLPRLVDAHALARRRGRREVLLVAGSLGWRYRGALRRIEQARAEGAVRLLGYVPDEDLPALYTLARALVFPSLYEGFGLPIVEAMACGTPVVTSDRPATAEAAGGAAILVDPTSAEAIADGLMRVLAEEALRAELRAAGLRRAASLTWADAARHTVAVYEHARSAAAVPPSRGRVRW
jgi:glycosyltransferase involved in cell wall biosynthesis